MLPKHQTVYDRLAWRPIGCSLDSAGFFQDEEEPNPQPTAKDREQAHHAQNKLKSSESLRVRARARVVDPQLARAALLAVARARARDPELLYAQAPSARDRRHRRRARHEPLDDPPLRHHAARARLPRARRLAQVPPGTARDRSRHVRAQLDRAGRARAPLPRRAAPAHLLHGQPRGARWAGDPVRRPRAQFSPRAEPGEPRCAHRLATARVLHRDGQAAGRQPARGRPARADRVAEAGQTRAQHDHLQESAARRARRGARRELRRRRRRARQGPVRDRRAGSQRGTRRRRRCGHRGRRAR